MYLFHLIVFLNTFFNSSNNVLSSYVNKVTTGTYTLVPVILNVASVGLSTSATAGLPPREGTASLVALPVNTKFLDQAKIKDTSKLINGISNVLQKLLKYFNGKTISISFVLLVPLNFPVTFVLNSKKVLNP